MVKSGGMVDLLRQPRRRKAMNCKIMHVIVFCLPLAICAGAHAASEAVRDVQEPTQKVKKECEIDTSANRQPQPPAVPGVSAGKAVTVSVTAGHPKVVFQINQAADAPTILRFVTNYLKAEPAAEVAVVGYGSGVDFMLKGARDAAGKPYAEQLQSLAGKGVAFKVCNNTLKARNLTADAVAANVTVVPGAVNEIIRLQTREGYAYFRH